MFAAGAATTVTLAILNETSVGDIAAGPLNLHHGLTRPTWFGVGMTALTLAIALPTTVVVNKASQRFPRTSDGNSTIICPSH